MEGRIVRQISNLYTVESDGKTYECRARGNFRVKSITPLVGDLVTFDETDKYILDILPRKNELKRPVIANVDCAIIVTSLKRPDFAPNLLDKMLTNVILNDIEPIVVLTKYDLLDDEEKEKIVDIIRYYNHIGIKTVINQEIPVIENYIDGKIVVLTGQTGVGKSTLLNMMDENLNLATNDISEALGRGKHTTRHVELFHLGNALIADTPGFSAFEISDEDKENIRFAFPEFDNDGCKFKDCHHLNELGCKVLEDLEDGKILKSRYDSYRKMVMK